jgi:broad specificity phosphatase PhoE
MAIRMLLICHASTAATRGTAFPLDEPLEPAGLAAAGAAAHRMPAGRPARCGPALRCRQTAQALGLTATVDAGLADWDLGHWAGRSLDDLVNADPEAVLAWTTDPACDVHGGETQAALIERVGSWLDAPPVPHPDRFLAVTHPAWLRSAVVHALQAPAQAFWRIDVAPLAAIELRGRPGHWSLYPHPI